MLLKSGLPRGLTAAPDARRVATSNCWPTSAQQITELPSYGYRRACALVNRQRASVASAARESQARVPRDGGNGLLLPKAPRRPQSSRPHDGTVSVQASDMRWCSDGFEIKCDSGQTVTATFAKDCCDREIMAFRAWEGKGLPGEPVREMLIEAVEKRFGAVEALPAGHTAGVPLPTTAAPTSRTRPGASPGRWASRRSTRRCAARRATAWPRASSTPSGATTSAAWTSRDAPTVLAQLPAAFEHFNEVHPHSSLKMRSPREFRRQRVEQLRHAQLEQPALHCE